jgi:DNA-binding transcriptional regulator YhcF (GntR family)
MYQSDCKANQTLDVMIRTAPIERARPQQERIVQSLRGQIVEGNLPPGSRVPSRRDLAERLSASLLTVQQALDRLARDGFVEARGRAGTFVSDRPPHLVNIALVFEHLPNERVFPRLWTALANEAHGFDSKEVTLTSWLGVSGHADNEDFQRLCTEIRNQRIGGLIFPARPHVYLNTPLLDAPGIPRVAPLSVESTPLFPTVTPIRFGPWLERALEYLAARGRRKVALIQGAGVAPPDAAMVRRLGLSIKPYMVQAMIYSQPESARPLAHLMVRREQADAPDALVIADDNLVEYATAGIVDAGVRVPEDLEVVAHCNFPWPTPSALPVRRLGYDVREYLRHALASIGDRRCGHGGPARTLHPIFEDEMKSV